MLEVLDTLGAGQGSNERANALRFSPSTVRSAVQVASVRADKAPSDDLKIDELFSDLVGSTVRNIEPASPP
jgi:hypothetical protein